MVASRLQEMVIGLDEPQTTDPRVAGHKAANLARLAVAGFRVPAGVVLTAEACRAFSDPANASTAREALGRALDVLGGGPLAVRSSGVAEDLPGQSFAGQYETILNVVGLEALSGAVDRCLASAMGARVRAYAGSGEDAAPMAILIQHMVDADAAGVAFTADPVTGDRDRVLVSAVKGLADRLVGGEANPDEWVIRNEDVERVSSTEDALTAEQARRVAVLASEVEATMGGPQDIEWAIAADQLFLLQARPITALPVEPVLDIPSEGRWEKDEAHYPAPLTPFGASVYLPALDASFGKAIEPFGLLIEGWVQRSLGGEVYMRMIPLGGRDGKPPPWWVVWLAARLTPAIRRRAKAAEEAFRTDLPGHMIDRWYREWRDELRRDAAGLRAVDLETCDDAALLAHLDAVKALLLRGEEIHFALFPPYLMALYELMTTCEELLGWDAGRAILLVAGTSGASSEPGRRLGELAQVAAASPAAMEVLGRGGADVLDHLRVRAPEVAAAFEAYMEEHGHRTLSYDPGDPTLAQRPDLLAGLLRDRIADQRSGSLAVAEARANAIEQARAALATRTAAERERFEKALAFAERAYPVREDNIVWTDNVPSGLLRYAAVEIGRRLTERGVLGAPEDAVFLSEGELRAALLDGDGDLRPLVGRRRAERAWVIAHPGPAAYGPAPDGPPDFRGLQPSLQRVMGMLVYAMQTMMVRPPERREGELLGVAGSPGTYRGTVRVIRQEGEFGRLGRGDVLVCPITSPAWSILFGQAGAIVTDGGGLLAHAAVIAREYGIPAVLATRDGTQRLRDGQIVTVDGTAGVVTLA